MKFIFSYKLCISLGRQPSPYCTNSTSVIPSYRTNLNKVCILPRSTCLPGTVEEEEEPGSAQEQEGRGQHVPLRTVGFLPGGGTCRVTCGFWKWEEVLEAEKPNATLQRGSLPFWGRRGPLSLICNTSPWPR